MENKKRYVQHISGQGEKWEVHDEEDNLPLAWRVLNKSGQVNFYLPKSEYVLCEPPEVWVDVTWECQVDDYSNRSGGFWSILYLPTGANVMSKCNDGYRLRKVTVYAGNADHPKSAFIVERKQ